MNKKYSAGAVSHSFWYTEFCEIINLLNQGYSYASIIEQNKQSPLFNVSVISGRSKRMLNTIITRIKSLPIDIIKNFFNFDIMTRKCIVLMSIMLTDKLFFDFIYEMIYLPFISGVKKINNTDIRVFFSRKQLEHDEIAKWTDLTIKRLASTYKVYIKESGIVSIYMKNVYKIDYPILSENFCLILEENNLKNYVKIFKGQ